MSGKAKNAAPDGKAGRKTGTKRAQSQAPGETVLRIRYGPRGTVLSRRYERVTGAIA